jgi:hypothetical protein
VDEGGATRGQNTARTDRNVRRRRRRRGLILAAAFRRLRKRKAQMDSTAEAGTRKSRVRARRHGPRMPHVTEEGGWFWDDEIGIFIFGLDQSDRGAAKLETAGLRRDRTIDHVSCICIGVWL